MTEETIQIQTGPSQVGAEREQEAEVAPRGISVPILLDHVRNTVPFLFEGKWNEVFIRNLLEARENPERSTTHSEYFRLCVSAHFATVSSFVPTDVDNQIRHHLWHSSLENNTILEMLSLLYECLNWDTRRVSSRVIECPALGESLSGHHGEWFSIASGAYACLLRRKSPLAADLAAAIIREVDREAKIFETLWREKKGIACLLAATTIAHNLGDLDRVLDMWYVSRADPLKELVYEAGHRETKRWGKWLYAAGELNKRFMANENHRHFSLRKPKCLRRSPDLLLPLGPFFDEWGKRLAWLLTLEEVGEVAQALLDGWNWLSNKAEEGEPLPVGYARAISGIIEGVPGGQSTLESVLPRRDIKQIRAGTFRLQLGIPRERFERQWDQSGIKFLGKFLG